MKEIIKAINRIIKSEIIALIIFGVAYLIAVNLPDDSISDFIERGIIVLYSFSAILIPVIVKKYL